AKDAAAFKEEKTREYREKFANPYVAAERGYVDEVIEPKDTRARLCAALETVRTTRGASGGGRTWASPARFRSRAGSTATCTARGAGPCGSTRASARPRR